ncbi:hypothetical protein F4813DRAFT_171537 [Daldinia decipiens]|uniref:uncharacterized protein n=1 Tax=Daldinia decipiens TaxID=326647 RepID=UPI0020C3EA02|nr:uncharacterized protein F4813DRAFT_171537 [Daldinia decipiens]KAI1661736.1 hypothetical protein F4813DRAFT_171537 [Daldinia decipiens]
MREITNRQPIVVVAAAAQPLAPYSEKTYQEEDRDKKVSSAIICISILGLPMSLLLILPDFCRYPRRGHPYTTTGRNVHILLRLRTNQLEQPNLQAWLGYDRPIHMRSALGVNRESASIVRLSLGKAIFQLSDVRPKLDQLDPSNEQNKQRCSRSGPYQRDRSRLLLALLFDLLLRLLNAADLCKRA